MIDTTNREVLARAIAFARARRAQMRTEVEVLEPISRAIMERREMGRER